MSDRVDVLDKVKNLLLMPVLDTITTQQVADYYEVNIDAVQSCYRRNKSEIDSDGVIKETSKSLEKRFGQNGQIVKTQYYQDFRLSDDVVLRIPNVGIKLFSQRSVLRIGMLLRDSDVAKEIRTQLLNTVEHSTDEQKTAEIDEETSIMLEIGRANMDGDEKAYKAAVIKAFAFKNRKNEALQVKNDELAVNNKALAGEVLTWTTRDSVNKAVRVIAGTLHQPFGYVWKYLYDELLYHHHISLSMRGKPPVLKYLHEDEWPKFIQSLAAVCEKYGLSFDKIMKKARLSLPEESNL